MTFHMSFHDIVSNIICKIQTWILDLNICEYMLLIYRHLEMFFFVSVYFFNFILSSVRFRLQYTYWIISLIGTEKCIELICSHKQLAKFM